MGHFECNPKLADLIPLALLNLGVSRRLLDQFSVPLLQTSNRLLLPGEPGFQVKCFMLELIALALDLLYPFVPVKIRLLFVDFPAH